MWWLACGRIDERVTGMVAWKSLLFGAKTSAAEVLDMHPLRRLEREPPTAEATKAEGDRAFDLIGAGLRDIARRRHGDGRH